MRVEQEAADAWLNVAGVVADVAAKDRESAAKRFGDGVGGTFVEAWEAECIGLPVDGGDFLLPWKQEETVLKPCLPDGFFAAAEVTAVATFPVP